MNALVKVLITELILKAILYTMIGYFCVYCVTVILCWMQLVKIMYKYYLRYRTKNTMFRDGIL